MMISATNRATLIGALAPIMWSFIPVSILILDTMNIYLVMLIGFTSFCLISLCYLIYKGENLKTYYKQSYKYYLNIIFGILGFHIFYFQALKLAPATNIILMINSGAIFIIFYAAIINKVKIYISDISALILTLIGILIIISRNNIDLIEYKNSYLGYIYAFIAINCWALYTIFSQRFTKAKSLSIIFPMFLIVFSLFFWLLFENKNFNFLSQINIEKFLFLILLGLGPMGFAIMLWNYGASKGNVKHLAVFGALNPSLASIWVILLGYDQFYARIIIAFLFIIAGLSIIIRRQF